VSGHPGYRPGYGRPYYPYYYRPYYAPYYYPGFYGGFYSPFYFGIGFGYGYGYGYPYYAGFPYAAPYYYYGPYAYDNTGSARLQVSPRNTQVYIDGHFVGVVDEFDGYLQRLNVEAGEHDLQLYLDGHKPLTLKVLFTRGGTVKVLHTMQPLAPGESAGPAPTPPEPRRAPSGSGPVVRQGPPPRGYRGGDSEFGSLLLRVRPSDATVLVDGEVWSVPEGPEGNDQFVIELGEGPHRVEVRKDGFQTYSTTVRVRRGETIRLNVSLTSGGVSGQESPNPVRGVNRVLVSRSR
jgi:hypothetical protein